MPRIQSAHKRKKKGKGEKRDLLDDDDDDDDDDGRDPDGPGVVAPLERRERG